MIENADFELQLSKMLTENKEIHFLVGRSILQKQLNSVIMKKKLYSIIITFLIL